MPEQFPIVFLNGHFVATAEAKISVFDRGFLYGDGLFETIRICAGKPVFWELHEARWRRGLSFLQMENVMDATALFHVASELISRNEAQDAVLRLTVSRGPGARGYAIAQAGPPTEVLSLHPAPRLDEESLHSWRLHIARTVLLPTLNSVSQHKTANKLTSILARAEAEDHGADEALLLDEHGRAAESASGNFFWVANEELHTVGLQASGVLPGVTRHVVMDICRQQKIPCHEAQIDADQLSQIEGGFITLSSLGIVEIASIDGIRISVSPLTRSLHRALVRKMQG